MKKTQMFSWHRRPKVDIPAGLLAADDLIPTDLMPTEWHWYYAFTEGQLLFTMGTSPTSMIAALDRKAGIGNRFSEHLSYQPLAETLGTDNNVLLAISPTVALKNLLQLLEETMPSLQLFSTVITSLPDNYSINLAAKAQDSGIDAHLLLNLGDFKQLAQMLGMMAQVMPQMEQRQ
ncbi:hypothetical protein F4054_09385 [Candidatus Poribacteria bacterium]|nr:hypothetical protein [Candidatus Poribacteria bacterium]MYG05142.1 hypothetical protein [Candidatus Poribacteria bacterium]MYK22462.1 hypothetical protein [Candidatus Poribacteria bacterium]